MAVHKVRVAKVALEIVLRSTLVPDLVPHYRTLTRGELLAEVEAIVQADRLKLTDATFRIKYLDFIRNYWGIHT